jgi:uroporphyrinogen decarboxylase
MLFLDDSTWVREMVEFWGDYLARLLKRLCRCVVPDMIVISEDIAYKRFPMISPAMAREFLLPVYRSWGEIILGSGCPLYAVDSDGYIGDLIPVWMEAGVNVTLPVEIAAGNDVIEWRRQFGKGIAMQGGVDKRAIARGGESIRGELDRLVPILSEGGLIPICDHAVPSDVSWPNYLEYVRVLAEKTGWL